MTKATCSKCGHSVYLVETSPEGTEYWTISDAIKHLLDKMKRHECEKESRL